MEQEGKTLKNPAIQTLLLSIITAAVLGSFSFQWSMNRDFGIMQERDRVRSDTEMEWKNDLKELKIDVNELKGKMIRLESTVKDINYTP